MKFTRRHWRSLCRTVAVLGLVFVIALSLLRITVSLISPQSQYFEKILSQTLHHPVKIRAVSFGWHGLNPLLRFDGIQVEDAQTQQKILTIKQLNFSIGFFSSLWHREILPSSISLIGAQLDLYQNQDGSWQILNNQKTNVASASDIGNWILAQSHANLSDLNLTVHYANGVSLVIQNLQLQVKQKHYPTITGNFSLASGGDLDFNWQWLDQSSIAAHSQLDLKVNNLLLEPWLNSSLAALNIKQLPLLSGVVNGQAQFNWQAGSLSDASVKIHSLNLSEFNKGVGPVKVAAEFSLHQGNISGYFDADDISRLKQFLPDFLSVKAKAWLSSAFLAGSVQHAEVNWLQDSKQFTMVLPVTGATLHFAPGWPDVKNINAILNFNNKNLRIYADSGSISGNPILQVVAQIPDLTQSYIVIDSITGGTLQNGLDFLGQAPLPIAPFVKNWQGQGPISINLHLLINLKNKKKPVDSSGVVHFNNDDLIAPNKMIAWHKMQGTLSFDNNKLTGNNLTGEFLDSPLNLSLGTRYLQNRPIYLLNFLGNLKLNQPYLKGSFPYKAALQLSLKNKQSNFVFDAYTNFMGLASSLPVPLNKNEKTELPFSFHLRGISSQNYLLSANLANIFSAIAEIKNNSTAFQVLRGRVSIGQDNANLPKLPGLFLSAKIALLDFDAWQAVWDVYKKQINSESSSGLDLNWRSALVDIKKVIYQKHDILQNHYSLLAQKSSWAFSLKNSLLDGTLIIPRGENKTWQANFSYVDLPTWFKSSGDSNPGDLPSLNLACNNFSYHARSLGQLNLSMTSVANGLKINSFSIKSKQFNLSTSGTWSSIPQNLTHLSGDFATQNLGALIVAFGISPVIYQGYGVAHFDLNWPLALPKITAAAASGHVSFDFDDGRIMKLSDQAESDLGLGKILNLLSLQSLPFTLASGFQSLGQKGFQFDELKGTIELVNGKGSIKSLSLVGPIAWITATGQIDFNNKLYNLQLKVIPNITSSIPLILAIASGPIAGVIGLVANKILGAQIGKAAEQNITVKGSWENPQVVKIPKPQTTKAG